MTIITQFPAAKRTVKAFAGTVAVICTLLSLPVFAVDPFRTNNPRELGENTHAAFESIFKEGDYKGAKKYLKQAKSTEADEPLVYAMLSSLAYTDRDWEDLKSYASKTLSTAQQLLESDPLRGNLYTAVGHFLEGAYKFEKEGPISTLSKLQKVFQYLDEAKKIDANDPELNLITGYMDLMLAVNLPFSDPAEAVAKLEKYASPSYLVYRGIAVGYRDLKKHSEAMEFAERALELTPDNPEVIYLKAQILVNQGKHQDGLELFNKALEKGNTLPNYSVAQIAYEHCRLTEKIDNIDRDCRAERNRVRDKGI
ncbi:MAG: tetratricopeptide repeat protein [Symploca sp. SIO3C6]|uniref:Tetratricopeptide repeat protein n=1 Tax=Symploca sp. SIO1C4 TaxID=2607765 RepID=A0A6B3NFA1_9CYAN|nr:tetratricopeptide repeat protein [Symploca sp. SIO3C6]NER28331.1 tetratricopeptide repeat protein [Symploca sp. SIO1C4]NET04483.1 tetratricopeptide repeat protein [Symploca sp. SIO2B6]